MIVGRPVARHLQDGQTAEVTRLCVPDGAPRNVCSFLYARAVRAARELGWKRLVTYTLESEAGASLRAAGWKPVAEVAPQATWARPARDRDDATHRTVSRRVRWEIAL